MKQLLTFTNRVHLPFHSQPIRHGVPWPQGVVRNETALIALDENRTQIPLAARVLNCWPDGSVQWSLLDLALDFDRSATRVITIETREGATPSAKLPNPVMWKEEEVGITVGNGLASLSVHTAPSDS